MFRFSRLTLLPFLLFSFLSSGCVRDHVPFEVAAAGLVRPTIFLDAAITDGIVSRILWLEEARYWSQSRFQAHGLQRLLGDQKNIPAAPACGETCDTCLTVGDVWGFGVDERLGKIDAQCWTRDFLIGSVILEVPTLGLEQGEGFEDWNNLCRATDKSSPRVTNPICMTGHAAYRASLVRVDREAIRMDLLWVVGLWVREGDTGRPNRRLDAIKGFVYQTREKIPTVERSAVLLDEKSVIYQKFQGENDVYSVELLGTNGHFLCKFALEAEDRCESLDGKGQSFDFKWPE